MSEESEIARIRLEHAELVKEKARLEADWHQEVRTTLKSHGESLVTIKQSLGEHAQFAARLSSVEGRLSRIEEFKVKFVAIMSFAMIAIAALWKIVDKLWK